MSKTQFVAKPEYSRSAEVFCFDNYFKTSAVKKELLVSKNQQKASCYLIRSSRDFMARLDCILSCSHSLLILWICLSCKCCMLMMSC